MLQYLIPAAATYFLTQKSKNSHSSLSIKGVIEVKHLITNRIRAYVPLLKGNQEKIDHVLTELKKIDVVYSADASVVTGSLTLTYDQGQIEPVLLLGVVVRLLGIDLELSVKETGELEKEFTTITESLDKSLLQVSAGKVDTKSAITAVIVSGLIYQGIKNGASFKMLPTPLTLIWWLYQNNLINKGK